VTHLPIPDDAPTPDSERRDSMGRLVSVTWHGAEIDLIDKSARWLVAVDGSACSLRAVAMVARLLALAPRGEVDLVHVHAWLSKEAAETELARSGWATTAPARQLLDAAALRWHLHAVMGEAAAEIVGLAETLGNSSVAIGSRGLTAAESVLLGSVAYTVVHRARIPVLVVR
jgi:nucleotide-binding universal stress UspA family protein